MSTFRWSSFAALPELAPPKHPSFKSSHSCLAADFFPQTIPACYSSIFFTSCGQTTPMSTATRPSSSKVCHCGRSLPRSRVWHMPAPAGPLTALSMSGTSKICFLHALMLLPSPSAHPHAFRRKERGHGGQSPRQPPNHAPPRREMTRQSTFLPAAASCCRLNFNLSVGETPTACPPHLLAKSKPIRHSFLAPILMYPPALGPFHDGLPFPMVLLWESKISFSSRIVVRRTQNHR